MSNKGIDWAMSLERPRGYKSVLVAMADSANPYMATWAKRKTIAKKVGLKEDTVRDYQNKAVKDGDLILVPWQSVKGGDATPGYFLGCAREMFAELPPLEVAFEKRINFGGPGKGGRPREFKPSWWSGERTGTGHRCTSCGGVCHGDEAEAEQAASKVPASASVDVAAAAGSEPAWGPAFAAETPPDQPWTDDPFDPTQGRLEEVGEGVSQGYPEPFTEDSRGTIFDPGEGRVGSTLQGRLEPTLPGSGAPDPFNPKEVKPSGVSPKSSARPEGLAPAKMPTGHRVAGGGRSSGLPAGHGAKPAPRKRVIGDRIDESTATLRSPVEDQNRQREQAAISSALAALERNSGFEQARKAVEFALMALGWTVSPEVIGEARGRAYAAIRRPGWSNAETTYRYEFEVEAYALMAVLSTRPLASWPGAVLEPLGLAADGKAAA